LSHFRFVFFLVVIWTGFLVLGISLRFPEILQKLSLRQTPYAIQRFSDKLAVGKVLPLKDKLIAQDNRTHVFVIRNERLFFSGEDPIDCIEAQCKKEFGISFKRPGTALNIFTNVEYIPTAWGIPVISDRWGTRPLETFTVVAKGNGIVTAIHRYADIEDLDHTLGPTH
jgi:hypothetical protein